jgi:outer membrane protein assembly factor BamB
MKRDAFLKDKGMRSFLLSLLILAVVNTAVSIWADSWPQWMGPHRDNVWREEGLLEKFPAGGPHVVWRVPVAGGFGGPAVTADRVFVCDFTSDADVKIANFERHEFTGTERVQCLDEKTGKQKWHYDYPVKYTISYPAGPRCTPIVDGDKLYTLGAEGDLICFKAETGDIVWKKNLPQEYHTKTAIWGYAAHPLIDGRKLICLAGGEGTHAVALDKNTGAEIWRSSSAPEQGYSPPTIIDVGGKRELLLARPNALSAVDPETGHEKWSVPYEATSGSIIMSPVRLDKYVYLGGYANKSLLVELSGDGSAATLVWRDKAQHGISPINVQPFVAGGVMYGFDQNGRLYAVELPSGKRLWDTTKPVSERPAANATAFIVRQGVDGDRYWLFNDSGDLIIARLTPKGYEEIDRAHLIEPTNTAFGRDIVWSMPAFANKRMYVRNDKECICVELAK